MSLTPEHHQPQIQHQSEVRRQRSDLLIMEIGGDFGGHKLRAYASSGSGWPFGDAASCE